MAAVLLVSGYGAPCPIGGRSGPAKAGVTLGPRPMDATASRAAPAMTSRVPAVMRLVRSRQWTKNVLVLTAPFAAGDLLEGDVPLHTALAFVAFCLVASGVYCLNDARDVVADRAHPTKQHRPVASGEVSVGVAIALGVVLFATGLGVAAIARWQLVVVLACYVGVQVA